MKITIQMIHKPYTTTGITSRWYSTPEATLLPWYTSTFWGKWNLGYSFQYWSHRHQRKILMKYNVSRLKIFDLESMSDRTPQATSVRATERIPRDFKRWFPIQHFSQSKVSVENVVSDYGLGDLWRLVGANPEPVRIDNPSNAPENSTSPCTSDFTGRASTF